MGCWNASCAISGLPIFEGEEVYAFFLGTPTEEKDYDNINYCYATEMWQPMGWWFTGIYNDYGALENCKGMFKHTLELIRKNLVELDLGENKYHDIEVKKDKLDEKLLFEADHESRLFVKTYRKFRLRHITIKKTIFESIINDWKCEVYNWTKNRTKNDPVYVDLRDRLINSLNEKAKQWKETYDPNNVDDMIASMRFTTTDDEVWRGMTGLGNFYEMPEMWVDTFKLKDTKVRKQIEEQIINFNILNAFMNSGRRSWIPPSGSGSQSCDTHAQEFLAKVILKTAKEVKQKFEE